MGFRAVELLNRAIAGAQATVQCRLGKRVRLPAPSETGFGIVEHLRHGEALRIEAVLAGGGKHIVEELVHFLGLVGFLTGEARFVHCDNGGCRNSDSEYCRGAYREPAASKEFTGAVERGLRTSLNGASGEVVLDVGSKL